MCVSGRLTPGFSLAISGSFHDVILPMNMSAMTGPVRWILFGRPFTLYVIATAPSDHGIWMQPLQAVA